MQILRFLIVSLSLGFLPNLFSSLSLAADSKKINFDILAFGAQDFYVNYEIQDNLIRLGEILITNNNFGLKCKYQKHKCKIILFWPLEIFEDNSEIELNLGNGKNLLKKRLRYSDLELNQENRITSVNPSDLQGNNFYHTAGYSVSLSANDFLRIKQTGGLKFCLLQGGKSKDNKFREACTPIYQTQKNDLVLKPQAGFSKVIFTPSTVTPNLVGEIKLNKKEHQNIEFFAQAASGILVHFKDVLPEWPNIQVVAIDTDHFRVSAVGPRPYKYFMDHFTYKNKSFFYEYKYQPFWDEQENYWSFEVQNKEPELPLTFLNSGGGIYVAKIGLKNIPLDLQIPVVKDPPSPQLTYSEQKTFELNLFSYEPGAGTKLKKKQAVGAYTWTVKSIDRFKVTKVPLMLNASGQIVAVSAAAFSPAVVAAATAIPSAQLTGQSTAQLTTQSTAVFGVSTAPGATPAVPGVVPTAPGATPIPTASTAIIHPYFLEVYRGAPLDLGVQYTISRLNSANVAGQNINFNYWFDDFLGWTNSPLLRLRLGVYGKYFQTKKSKAAEEIKLSKLESANIGLKYRFTPGIWGRDESFGLLSEIQKLDYNSASYTMFGPGIFWARTMPKLFDDILNYIPFLNYPKWVNAEYIQLLALPSKLNDRFVGGYNLNFYGKIMWTPFVYGDLGFGVKSYHLLDVKSSKDTLLKLSYLTIGLGVNF
jgi:hypothetical protein